MTLFANACHRPSAAAFVLALLALAAPAAAVDGVLEINQACVPAGCFPGDSAGFPVQIANPGSYRLTSNLDVRGEPTPEDANAITILASNVTVDLNGFSIIGPVICTHAGCNIASGVGVGVSGGTNNSITVRNGVVSGMGFSGVSIGGAGTLVEGVHASANRVSGIILVSGLAVRNTATLNGGDGITVFSGSAVQNVASDNGNKGIDCSDGLVCQNLAKGNGGAGFGLIGCGYVDNVLVSNNGANPEVTGGFNLGQNLCNGAPCP